MGGGLELEPIILISKFVLSPAEDKFFRGNLNSGLAWRRFRSDVQQISLYPCVKADAIAFSDMFTRTIARQISFSCYKDPCVIFYGTELARQFGITIPLLTWALHYGRRISVIPERKDIGRLKGKTPLIAVHRFIDTMLKEIENEYRTKRSEEPAGRLRGA